MTGTLVFAVPGDIQTRTGGYLYDLKLMNALCALGVDVRHIALGDTFPAPTRAHATSALAQLQSLPPEDAALVDGLAYGALDTDGLRDVRAPLFALVHHPLALESGLEAGLADAMAARERANLALARHIFVTSPHTGGILSQHYEISPDRVTVVRPGFDPVAENGTAAKDTPPLILSVGILAQRKGHDILLRALSRLGDLPWQADIVGREHEPGMNARLSAQIGDLDLRERVRLSGEISDAALESRYRRATLFALATRYEGYGIVFGEAMAYGLPIVSTRVGAVPETVAKGAGMLVPADDPEAFTGALRRLLTDAKARETCTRAGFAAGQALAGWSDAAALVRDRLPLSTAP